jgi:hypothetical protein
VADRRRRLRGRPGLTPARAAPCPRKLRGGLIALKVNIPTDRLPWFTITLIAANVIVYALAVSLAW